MFKYKLLIFINCMVVLFFIEFGPTEVSRFSGMYSGFLYSLFQGGESAVAA